ncbi:MAG: response regulator transcription factor [Chitinophagales bacterium]
MNQNLLLVEDDTDLGNVMKHYLEAHEFEVELCRNGLEGLNSFKTNRFDLCILDIMMPEMDGFDLAKRIKNLDEEVPFIFLTAKNQKWDRVKGLALGADDYITKPFEIDELVLRIQNILRRTNRTKMDVLQQIGVFSFDRTNLLLKGERGEFSLTLQEAKLLQLLWDNRNEVVTREAILTRLWGENDYFAGRSMDVFISRLRKYLSSDDSVQIENRRGVGFALKVSK